MCSLLSGRQVGRVDGTSAWEIDKCRRQSKLPTADSSLDCGREGGNAGKRAEGLVRSTAGLVGHGAHVRIRLNTWAGERPDVLAGGGQELDQCSKVGVDVFFGVRAHAPPKQSMA